MTKRTPRGNRRQRDFRVVARGVRRVNPDLSRILKTTLDHHLSSNEAAGGRVVDESGRHRRGEEGRDVSA